MSNKLIDILDDKEKVDKLNDNYHYRQSILPKLEKLLKNINIKDDDVGDYGFVHDLRYDLKLFPEHRITTLEMEKCNKLWRKYK